MKWFYTLNKKKISANGVRKIQLRISFILLTSLIVFFFFSFKYKVTFLINILILNHF